jgi:hypothetical protein
MALINCERCGNLFNSLNGQLLCRECAISENNDLKKINEFLLCNPNATAEDASAVTVVSRRFIFKLIKNGSLSIKKQLSNPVKRRK